MEIVLTVSSDTNRVSTAGNGVTTVFSTFPVVFFDASTLNITLVTDATGIEVLQTITTNYTVTGGAGEAGTVTMVIAPAVGETLVIERVEPFTQGLDLNFQSRIPSPSLEQALDKIVMQIQRLNSVAAFFLNASQTAYDAVSRKITNLADGTLSTDAINKSQLDAAVLASGNLPSVSPVDNDKMLAVVAGAFATQTPSQIRALLQAPSGADLTVNASKTQVASDRERVQVFQTGAPGAGFRLYSLLPAATAGAGFIFTATKVDTSIGSVRLDPDGAETIDGFTHFDLVETGDTASFMSDGARWKLLSKSLKPLVTKFTASGTHTPTLGRRTMQVEGVAGGGGGGSCNNTAAGQSATGQAGGAGEYGRVQVDVDIIGLGTSVPVTVGAGGAGGAGGNTSSSGTAGTGTSYGTFLVLNPGSAGAFANDSPNFVFSQGGDGGTGGTGDFLVDGGKGTPAIHNTSNIFQGNRGGASYFGDGSSQNAVPGSPGPATVPGAGGGGGMARDGANSRPGGAGADGVVIVTEI